MQVYKNSVDNINLVLNYLGTRPYQEVEQLIAVIRSGKVENDEVSGADDEPKG